MYLPLASEGATRPSQASFQIPTDILGTGSPLAVLTKPSTPVQLQLANPRMMLPLKGGGGGEVGAGVGVLGRLVGRGVGLRVAVAAGKLVGVTVGTSVSVTIGVSVATGVSVASGVLVARGVAVGVSDGTGVAEGSKVGVAVVVAVKVGLGVRVGVGSTRACRSGTSCHSTRATAIQMKTIMAMMISRLFMVSLWSFCLPEPGGAVLARAQPWLVGAHVSMDPCGLWPLSAQETQLQQQPHFTLHAAKDQVGCR